MAENRLWQTLTFFDVVPRWMQTIWGAPMPPSLQVSAEHPAVLFDFRRPEALATWGNLDDVVMGGVSQSRWEATPEGALFTGVVSTNNSGGFVSIRSRNAEPPLDLSRHHGLVLRLRGDGQRYKLFLRDAAGWDSLAHTSGFDTRAGEWQTVQIPFTGLIPVFRARTVNDANPLNTAQIVSFQIMLSKFERDGALNPVFRTGEFSLLIAEIGVYGAVE